MKQKKTITCMTFLLLGLGGLYAQDNVQATGGDALGSGGSSSYTVGQVVYTTNIGINNSIAQGVQQPYEISTTIGIEIIEINLDIIAFPNPTRNNLSLSIGNYNNEKLTYQIYDMQGKLLKTDRILSGEITISMDELPFSSYMLNVLDNNALIKTFKIVKN